MLPKCKDIYHVSVMFHPKAFLNKRDAVHICHTNAEDVLCQKLY